MAEDEATISATAPDWTREAKSFWAWNPSKSLLASIRAYQRAQGGLLSPVTRRLAVLRHRFWSAVTGADIPINCVIGGGLLMPHPNGIVVHPAAVIGPNCLLFQQVTLGAGKNGVPRLGGHVDVGAGAKILGGLTIGDHARIGAMSLVTFDVPVQGVAMTTVATPRMKHNDAE